MGSKVVAFIVMSAMAGGAIAAGNPDAGEQKSVVCQGCHGVDGNSVTPIFPKLAGQHASYLAKQLADLRAGARMDPTMSAFAAGLGDEDIADLAAYFSAQKPAAESSSATPEVLARGKKLYMGGDSYSGVPACASCHSPTGSGNPASRFPSLRTQYPAYTLKQLNDFKTDGRSNDPNKIMRDIAARLSANDITALSEYIATLP